MADNVQITAGSGTTVATDDVAGVHYQRVKLVDGTADSSTPIPGDAANGLDVDVTRVIPGTGATALGKAEDAAHASGDVGVLALGVRNNGAATVLTDADGDYSPLAVNDRGELFITARTNGSALAKLEDAPHADGDGGIALWAVRNDNAATAFTSANGDYSPLAVDNAGRLWTLPGGNVAHGAPDSGNPVKVGGVYRASPPSVADGNRVDLLVDAAGRAVVTLGTKIAGEDQSNDVLKVNIEGVKATYSATALGLAPAASATDILVVQGSSTKTVRVLRVMVSATATSSGLGDMVLLRRSTANTGGTSSSLTRVAYDSTQAAATATVISYTANPTSLGTLVGQLASWKQFYAAGAAPQLTVLDFGNRPGRSIVLRGTSEFLCLNLNGVSAPSGASLDIVVEWTEE